MQNAGKYIITLGIVFVIIGLLFYFAGNKLNWLGKLPGDIRLEKENFKFYFPITTLVLVTILINIIIKIFNFFK